VNHFGAAARRPPGRMKKGRSFCPASDIFLEDLPVFYVIDSKKVVGSYFS